MSRGKLIIETLVWAAFTLSTMIESVSRPLRRRRMAFESVPRTSTVSRRAANGFGVGAGVGVGDGDGVGLNVGEAVGDAVAAAVAGAPFDACHQTTATARTATTARTMSIARPRGNARARANIGRHDNRC